jgi:uncharacterized integral membrane protein
MRSRLKLKASCKSCRRCTPESSVRRVTLNAKTGDWSGRTLVNTRIIIIIIILIIIHKNTHKISAHTYSYIRHIAIILMFIKSNSLSYDVSNNKQVHTQASTRHFFFFFFHWFLSFFFVFFFFSFCINYHTLLATNQLYAKYKQLL